MAHKQAINSNETYQFFVVEGGSGNGWRQSGVPLGRHGLHKPTKLVNVDLIRLAKSVVAFNPYLRISKN